MCVAIIGWLRFRSRVRKRGSFNVDLRILFGKCSSRAHIEASGRGYYISTQFGELALVPHVKLVLGARSSDTSAAPASR